MASPSNILAHDTGSAVTSHSETTPAGPSAPATAPETPTLSKKALKRAAKAEHYAAIKVERRAREKEAKRQKKAERAAKRAAGELDSADEAAGEAARRSKRARTSGPKEYFGARVVVDLSFDDKMTDKEVHSLTGQLSYVYAANRRADKAFRTILYTGLNGRTKERLDATGEAAYKRWSNCEWWEEGYENLWRDNTRDATGVDTAHSAGTLNAQETDSSLPHDGESIDTSTVTMRSHTPQSNVVYLTADTDEELMELLPTETYILGGIVDRNRYKNLCLEKAKKSGVRVARLPIGRYMAEMQTRKVLTVNQVFEILLKWLETHDWEESLRSVMPKRKLPSAPAAENENEAARIAPLLSDEGGIDVSVEPARDDKNGLVEEKQENDGEEHTPKDPAMVLSKVDVVGSSIEVNNIRN